MDALKNIKKYYEIKKQVKSNEVNSKCSSQKPFQDKIIYIILRILKIRSKLVSGELAQ